MRPWMALLGITISSEEISGRTQTFWDDETIAVVERVRSVLEDVGVSCTLRRPPSILLERTYHQFMELARGSRGDLIEVFSQQREVERLSWALDYGRYGERIIDSQYLDIALEVIDESFVYGMLSPLVSLLWRDWLSLPSDKHAKLKVFLGERIEKYRGTHPQLNLLKVYREFFVGKNGPQQLASLMKNEGLSLWKTGFHFPFVEDFRGMEYLGEVLFYYVKYREGSLSLEQIEEVVQLIKEIDRDLASSLCLTPMVLLLYGDDSLTIEHREKILHASLELLGDPVDNKRWRIGPGASSGEKEELERARERLMGWYTKEYLPLFLERIEMDGDRQVFWLDYIEMVEYFCVYSGEMYYDKLMEDSRLRVKGKERIKRLVGDRRASALALIIRGWVFFVFSKKGHASYVYDSESTYCPSIRETEILTLEDLKRPGEVETLRHKRDQEFRLIHRRGWQDRLREWLSYHLEEKGS